MRIRNLVAAGVFALAMPLASGAHAQAGAPVTFNVKVKVDHLMPEVQQVAVKCAFRNDNGGGGGKFGLGEGQAEVVDGAFDGVITVPVGGDYSLQSLQTMAKPFWECDLFMVNDDGSEVFAGGNGAPVWAQPATAGTFNPAIGGKFPPTAKDGSDVRSIDPKTGQSK